MERRGRVNLRRCLNFLLTQHPKALMLLDTGLILRVFFFALWLLLAGFIYSFCMYLLSPKKTLAYSSCGPVSHIEKYGLNLSLIIHYAVAYS